MLSSYKNLPKLKLLLRVSLVFSTLFLMTSCATISGVGTDNTPAPTKLEPLSAGFTPRISQSISLTHKLYAYTYDDGKLYTATHSGIVQQYDLTTGKLVWQKDLDVALMSSMGASNSILFVGSESGNVYALDNHDGKILWKNALNSQINAAPLFSQDKIIVKTLSGQLIAMNSNNGQILWQNNHGSPLMVLSKGSAPKLYKDKVIVGYADGKLCAYSNMNGSLLWETQIAQPSGATDVEQMIDIASNLQIVNGIIYTAAYQGNLSAVDANTGRSIWQTPLSAYKGLIVSQNGIFLTDAQSALMKINPDNGAVLFTQNKLKFRGLTTPVIAQNMVVVGDKQGYVHYLDLYTGKMLSRININSSAVVDLFVRDNLLYALTKDGVVDKIQS